MSRENLGLREAMDWSAPLLSPLRLRGRFSRRRLARMGVHELRQVVHQRVSSGARAVGRLSITFESFGFKHRMLPRAMRILVFDARSLPNTSGELRTAQSYGRDPVKWPSFLRIARQRRSVDRRHRALHARARSGIPGDEPRLSDDRSRLHGWTAPLGVHRRSTGWSLRARYSHVTVRRGGSSPMRACFKPAISAVS